MSTRIRMRAAGATATAVLIAFIGFGGAAAAEADASPPSTYGNEDTTLTELNAILSEQAALSDEGDVTVTPMAWTCDVGIICGSIKNSGTINITVTTKYVSPTQTGSGAHTMVVKPGGRATGAGAEYDWDAFWVPKGYCGASWGGPFWNSYSTLNRIDKTSGNWKKVDDFGASVKLKAGSCPT